MNDLHRIIDANLNRASEGLRVLEDLARFSLNHSTLCKRIKDQRHALQTGISQLGIDQAMLLGVRDIACDVGTSIHTPTEASRSQGKTDIATAAAKRSQEALRSIEEASKGLRCSGTSFESIRYALYDIERDLVLMLTKPQPIWPVCVLLTTGLCLNKSPEGVVHDIARAGVPCIQVREKDMTGKQLMAHCNKITKLAHDLGMKIIINDRVDIALACNADGVHLGQDDLPIDAARAILGQSKYIGKSCSSIQQLRESFSQSADYCGLGPIFPSSTKIKSNILGVNLLDEVMTQDDLIDRPLLAISGINTSTIDQVTATGFPGVAVSSAVCSAQDPYESCKLLLSSFQIRESCGI